MKVFLCLPYVRALLHEPRGKAQGKLLRQLHLRELETLRDFLVRKGSGKRSEHVTLLGELLEQRRQRCLDLCQLRFLGGDVQSTGVTGGKLSAQDPQGFGVDGDRRFGR